MATRVVKVALRAKRGQPSKTDLLVVHKRAVRAALLDAPRRVRGRGVVQVVILGASLGQSTVRAVVTDGPLARRMRTVAG